MTRKVCPNCKQSDEIVEVSYPTVHYERITFSPQRGSEDSDDFDMDIEEEWNDYDAEGPDREFYCANCDYQYKNIHTYDDIWEQMVWRKK